MPRAHTQKMAKRLRCGFPVERTKYDWQAGETVTAMEPCGQPAASHRETISIKRKGENAGVRTVRPPKVTDHAFTDPYHQPVKCGGCEAEIPVGDTYRYWKPKGRGTIVRCMKCGTPPRSFFTSSEIKATCWDIADQDIPEFDDAGEAAEFLREQAQEVRAICSEIEDKIYNIEEHFPNGSPVSEELADRRDELESWADEMDSVADEIESDTACTECGEDEENHTDHVFDGTDGTCLQETEDGICGITEDEHLCGEYEAPDPSDRISDVLGECPE